MSWGRSFPSVPGGVVAGFVFSTDFTACPGSSCTPHLFCSVPGSLACPSPSAMFQLFSRIQFASHAPGIRTCLLHVSSLLLPAALLLVSGPCSTAARLSSCQ
eukprot:15454917-Alexandrium_andersonii.AAC.1